MQKIKKYTQFFNEYPVIIFEKKEGIRCSIEHGIPVLERGIEIKNELLRNVLAKLPTGVEGELVAKKGYGDILEIILRENKEIDGLEYRLYEYNTEEEESFLRRHSKLNEIVTKLPSYCKVLQTKTVETTPEVLEEYKKVIESGGNGLILKKSEALYEEVSYEFKNYYFGNGVIRDAKEKYTDINPETKQKSLNRMWLSGMLGTIVVEDKDFEEPFSIFSGFTNYMRKELWKKKEELMGKVVWYKYPDLLAPLPSPMAPEFLLIEN